MDFEGMGVWVSGYVLCVDVSLDGVVYGHYGMAFLAGIWGRGKVRIASGRWFVLMGIGDLHWIMDGWSHNDLVRSSFFSVDMVFIGVGYALDGILDCTTMRSGFVVSLFFF